MTRTPVFQYKIPYEEWYFIVTSGGLHFYFNKSKRKSYWQLYDIFQDNPDIDKNEFIDCFNMEDVAVLMSRVNGLKGLDGYFFKRTESHDKNLQDKSIDVDGPDRTSREELKIEEDDPVDTREKEKEEEEEEEGKIEDEVEKEDEGEEEAIEYDQDAKNEFIRNLLLEEGYIKEETEDKEEEIPGRLNLGYSSSEDESESEEVQNLDVNHDDNNEKVIDKKNMDANEDHNESNKSDASRDYDDKKNNEKHSLIQDKGVQSKETQKERNTQDTVDSDNETQNNLGLDLTLSDDETDNTQEFLRLLDSYKDKICVYNPWFMVEEELLPELITKPEYYSIDDSSERERLFNQWCKAQQDEYDEKNVVDVKPSMVYPTITQMYFKYLQNHKKELKKYFYPEFCSKFSNEIDLTFSELLAKERESLFRQYKIMITDHAEYEKKQKQSGMAGTNLKKLKIDTYLKKNSDKFANKSRKDDVLQVENSTEDAFSKWAKICNLYEIPTSVGNSVENFIVGDEKRLESYIEIISRT